MTDIFHFSTAESAGLMGPILQQCAKVMLETNKEKISPQELGDMEQLTSELTTQHHTDLNKDHAIHHSTKEEMEGLVEVEKGVLKDGNNKSAIPNDTFTNEVNVINPDQSKILKDLEKKEDPSVCKRIDSIENGRYTNIAL